MNKEHILRNREYYLQKLLGFQDTDDVKIITGIRRCGKSSLLKLMQKRLIENGINSDQILSMNFESLDYLHFTSSEFYSYVKDKLNPKKRLYFFFDEVQLVNGWEEVINSLRVDYDCDIYVTGSNAFMMSSQLATLLSGRYVTIKMQPLTFKEFLDFHGYESKFVETPFHTLKAIITKDDKLYTPEDVFQIFARFGGMPGIADIGLDQDRVFTLLDSIYSSVVVRDIMEHSKLTSLPTVTDVTLLRKIVLFLADNIGNNVSANAISNVLTNEGLIENNKKSKISPSVVQNYIYALVQAFFFYEIKRYDIKGKQYLKTLGKYYIVDQGLRNYLLGFRNRDTGHLLENIVYLELISRGYDVAIGKIGDLEIDFIATNTSEKIYYQVSETMMSEEVRQRELLPLQKIDDNYEKVVLSLYPGLDTDYDGIKSLNVVDWLLAK